ncbi:hypothetical protein ACIPWY_38925 [Streptomyces sp. NPDC090032]|uniref:hypothetical protein n=1 Tax=unclassified Streptomyces TaxID=2593676 RepID=UPI0037146E5B
MLADELKASDVGLEFPTGEVKGSHGPSGIAFTTLAAMSGIAREYIRDPTFEGHESAHKHGKTIGGAGPPAPTSRNSTIKFGTSTGSEWLRGRLMSHLGADLGLWVVGR